MPLSLTETQAIAGMTGILYSFIPASGFDAAASNVGLGLYWNGGSKTRAISALLERTLEKRRDLFCELMRAIVAEGIKYRAGKGQPVTRDEIEALNAHLVRVRFKIPELLDPAFLDLLPRRPAPQSSASPDQQGLSSRLAELQDALLGLSKLESGPRGYAFETFLNALFSAFNLSPRAPFRIQGEQIDGSLEFDGQVYLIEAKWQTAPTGEADLLVFSGKVGGKTTWGRGLFISWNGFTEDGLAAFAKGRPSNLIAMTGQDLYFVLEGSMTLPEAIRRKSRRAAETGEIMVPVHLLSLERY